MAKKKNQAPPLNPEQRTVVEHFRGPLRVASCAGSGKTTSLVERVVYMVKHRKVTPSRILCITFSKTAAEQLRKRIVARLPGVQVGNCARTFHSVGLDIFRAESRKKNVTIDSRGVLFMRAAERAYREGGVKPELPAITQFSHHVKNRMLGRDPTLRKLSGQIDPRMEQLAHECAQEAAVTHEELLQAYFRLEDIRSIKGVEFEGKLHRFVTFDDMIYQAALLLQQSAVRDRWAKKWGYVMADEAQDTNVAQARIVAALCHESRNYVMVGDTSQAIYFWRGASPDNMLGFDKDWPGAKTILMHRNYRSGIEIVNLANRITDAMPADSIVTDDLGFVAQMTSERQSHAYVGFHRFPDPRVEGDAVAANIVEHQRQGVPLSDQAVLVRTNRMTRDIEIALALKKVPYKLVSGTSFFTMKEALALLSYARVVANRADADSVRTCIQRPSRMIGRKVIDQLVEMREPGEDWLDATYRLATSPKLRPSVRERVQEWLTLMRDLREDANDLSPEKFLRTVRSRTKMTEYFKKAVGNTEDSKTSANLAFVISFASNFDSIGALLDTVDAVKRHRKSVSRKRNGVLISTIHKQKGSEFSVVYVLGLSQSVFPPAQSDFNEERRVFYVACTRAKDELWLSYVTKVTGLEEAPLEPSELVREVGLVCEDEYIPGVQTDAVRVGTQMGLSL